MTQSTYVKSFLVFVLALLSQGVLAGTYARARDLGESHFRFSNFNTEVFTSSLSKSAGFLTDGTVKQVLPDGKGGRYVSGHFSSIQGIRRQNLAHLRADNSVNPDWNPSPNGQVDSLVLAGDKLMIMGRFDTVSGVQRRGMALLNTFYADQLPFNSETPLGIVNCMAISGSTMYIGGDFYYAGGTATTQAVRRPNIAAIDLSTGQATSWDPNAGLGRPSWELRLRPVRTMALAGNILYVGGSFDSIGGQARNGLAAFDIGTGLLTSWNPSVKKSNGNPGDVSTLVVYGNQVYIGGLFDSVGGQSRKNIASVGRASGQPSAWNPDANGHVKKLFVHGSTMYVGGLFNMIGGQTRDFAASFNLTTELLRNWNPSPNNKVTAFAMHGGKIFMAGAFKEVAGQARENTALVDTINGALDQWKPYHDYVGEFSKSRPGSYSSKTITPLSDGDVVGIVVRENSVLVFGQIRGRWIIDPRPSCSFDCDVQYNPIAYDITTGYPAVVWIGNTEVISAYQQVSDTMYFANETSSGSKLIAYTLNSNCRLLTMPVVQQSGPTNICLGDSVTLTMPAGFRYRWKHWGSDGIPTYDTTQSITIRSTRDVYGYTISNAPNGCKSMERYIGVTARALPTTILIDSSGPTTFCAGSTVTLTAPPDYRYLWSTGDTTQTITVGTSGSYSVQVIVGRCTSAASAAKVVTVNASAIPTITASSATTFCAGGSVILSAPAGFRYLWSTGDTTQTITADTSGSYSVRVIAAGCTSSVSAAMVVTVNPAPQTPTIIASGSTTFCTGDSVILSAPAGFRYLWSTGDTTQTITADTSGNYSVRVITASCTSSASAVTVVTVNPAPQTPTISTSGPTTFFVGDSVTLSAPSGFSYLWTTGATTESIVVKVSGSYAVQVISNGCTSGMSAAVVVTVNTPPANVWIWNGTGNYDQANLWDRNSVPPLTADSIVIESGVCTVPLDLEMGHINIATGASLVVNGNLTNQILHVKGSVQTGTLIHRQGNVMIKGGGLVSCSTYVNTGASSTSIFNSQLTTNKLTLGSNLSLTGSNALLKIAYKAIGEHGIQYAGGLISQESASQFMVEAGFDVSHTTTGGGAWANVGPPIQNYPVSDLALNNPFQDSTFNNSVPGNSSLYLYDAANTTWPANEGYVKAPNSGYRLTAKEGVRLWLRNSFTGPLQFRGYPFMTDQLFNLQYCTSNCAYESPNGFNLIKNPFAASLDWTNSAIVRNNVEGAIWVWRDSAQVFSTYNGGIGINGGRSMVALGQSFFVRADTSGASLTLPTSATTTTNVKPFRTAAIDNLIKLQVLEGSSVKDETAVRFNAAATTGFDAEFDASKLSGFGLDISSLMPSGRKLSINNLPLTGITRVPIQINRISGTAVQTLRVSLNSIDTGIVVLLAHPSFTSPMSVSDGFTLPLTTTLGQGLEIVAGPRLLSINRPLLPTLTLRPNPATTAVQVYVTSGTIMGLTVIDNLGRTLIRTNSLANDLLDISSLASGAYVVKVQTDNGLVTQRLSVLR